MQSPLDIAVTGGTGFIGSHLVERLVADGHRVRCLYRSKAGWLSGLDVELVQGDLSDTEAISKLCSGVDLVYHLAGVTGTKGWTTGAQFHEANVAATVGILDVVKQVAPSIHRVLITSSLAAVGSGTKGIADERTPLRPVSRYGESKKAVEEKVAEYMDQLPITIVRPPAVYGPRDRDILTFFQSAAKGLVPIVGRGDKPEISLVHVADLVDGIILAANSPKGRGETFFVAGMGPYAWNHIRDIAKTATGKGALTIHVPTALIGTVGAISEFIARLTRRHNPLDREKAREIRLAATMCSSDKARELLGYEPTTNLEKGISQTIQWYRDEGWMS